MEKRLLEQQDQLVNQILNLENFSFALKIAEGEFLYISPGSVQQLKGITKVKSIIGKKDRSAFIKPFLDQIESDREFTNQKAKHFYSINHVTIKTKTKNRSFLVVKFKIGQFPIPVLAKKAIIGILIIDTDSKQVQTNSTETDKTIQPSKFSQLIKEMKKIIKNDSIFEKDSSKKLKQLIPQLEKISNRDFLTGLFNRNNFEEIIQLEIKKSIRFKYPINILIIDIDDFKRINDNYGHLSGDAVLKDLSKVLRSSVRETDYICRWGGEEFVVMLPKCDLDDAQSIAEKLILNTRKKAFKPTKITVSIGIAQLKDNENITSWFIRADEALLKAKRTGKDKFSIALR